MKLLIVSVLTLFLFGGCSAKWPSWLGGPSDSGSSRSSASGGGRDDGGSGVEIVRFGTVISVDYRELGKKKESGWFGGDEESGFDYDLEVFMDHGRIYTLRFKSGERFLAGDRVEVRYWEGRVKSVKVLDRFFLDFF